MFEKPVKNLRGRWGPHRPTEFWPHPPRERAQWDGHVVSGEHVRIFIEQHNDVAQWCWSMAQHKRLDQWTRSCDNETGMGVNVSLIAISQPPQSQPHRQPVETDIFDISFSDGTRPKHVTVFFFFFFFL